MKLLTIQLLAVQLVLLVAAKAAGCRLPQAGLEVMAFSTNWKIETNSQCHDCLQCLIDMGDSWTAYSNITFLGLIPACQPDSPSGCSGPLPPPFHNGITFFGLHLNGTGTEIVTPPFTCHSQGICYDVFSIVLLMEKVNSLAVYPV